MRTGVACPTSQLSAVLVCTDPSVPPLEAELASLVSSTAVAMNSIRYGTRVLCVSGCVPFIKNTLDEDSVSVGESSSPPEGGDNMMQAIWRPKADRLVRECVGWTAEVRFSGGVSGRETNTWSI